MKKCSTSIIIREIKFKKTSIKWMSFQKHSTQKRADMAERILSGFIPVKFYNEQN